ncbi:hypothetical protein TNCV_2153941 [Trichonephila clavipes]|nr:hypothetical protein TNCV_2153941 [Trichonephila clavipes]
MCRSVRYPNEILAHTIMLPPSECMMFGDVLWLIMFIVSATSLYACHLAPEQILTHHSSSTARLRCGRALSSIKMKSGPMAPGTDAHGEEVPQNSDPQLQTLYRKCGAQFVRSA